MNEYVATFTLSAQVTEDSYKIFQYHLKILPTTTIAEILKWKEAFGKGCIPINLCITELEELKP